MRLQTASLLLLMSILWVQYAVAQYVQTNPLEWLALAEGNEAINGEIESQTDGQLRTAALQNTIAAEFNIIHESERKYISWHSFSRSYGVILPSSLTILLPSALGFSPHPPVSVYGTGILQTIAAFLDSQLTCFPTYFQSTSRLQIKERICQLFSYLACTGLSIPGSRSLPVSPQFCYRIVQEFQPVIHRLRLSTSP